MPVFYKSKGLFGLDRIYKWLKNHFRYDRLPPEPERVRHPHWDCSIDLDMIGKLHENDIIYLVSLPGASQEDVDLMVKTMKYILEPKPDSCIMVLSHKEVHLISQGKGRVKTIILQLVKNHGFKIKRNEDEQEARN